MRKIFLTFCILIFSFSFVYADRYFENGDIVQNRYYDALGYGIGTLLESERCPNCVEYDTEKVYGAYTSDILSNVHIDDVTDPDPVYGLMRLHYLYDEVALPPYSSLDFIYWSKSMAGSDVNISSIKMFLSRGYSYQGDLTKIVNIKGEYEALPIKYIVWDYPRSGLVKTYDGLGIVKDGEGVLRGMRLDTAYVKSPILFVSWEAMELDEGVLLRILVRNDSDQELRNVVYTHQEYSESRNFDPNEEHIYEYLVQRAQDGSLGYPGVYNPNYRTECIARGENLEANSVGDSAVVGGVREEDGGKLAYIGSRVKPLRYRFCVTVIPHTVYSSEIVLPTLQDDLEEEVVPSEPEEIVTQESSEAIATVMGIEKLPQTGLNINPFLVVFRILWYYLFRRNIL